jgi:hypothetical protein
MSKSNANINSQLNQLKNKYSTSSSIPVNNEANLLTQMNLYDDNKVENSILQLNELHDSQLNRLNNLKNEDPSQCIEKCNNFLITHSDIIDKQLDNIVELEKNIKNIVNECETIEQQEETLDKMLKEPKYVDLAEKIKKMRSTVDNLNHFLVRKKISNYIV